MILNIYLIQIKMKKTSIIFALAFALGIMLPFSSAKAEKVQYWAKGVSVEGGWYNTFQFTNGCWAAVSSNMIAWWQDRIKERYIYTGKCWDPEEINREFDRNTYFGDNGDYVFKALDWYLKETHPTIVYSRTDNYQNYLPTDDYDNPIIFTRGYIDSNEKILTDVLLAYFTTGNYIVQIRDNNHAWTLWAIEVDTETKKITRIWVTDSVPNDRNNPKKEIFSLEPKHYDKYFYFERGIYDEENNAWDVQALHPEELTFFGIEGRFLVDSEGEPVFKSNSPTAPTQVEVKMNAADQLQDMASIATFSAPFDAVVPDGAKAWYVKQVDGDMAQLTAVPEGYAIPAEQGVLLTTNSATDVLVMEQADASTPVAELTDNRLQANAQGDHVIASDDNAYVLAIQQGQMAFYRAKVGSTLPRYKAYLQWNATFPAITMNFAGTQTAISNVVGNETNVPIAVYGIDGRKCSSTQTKGVYIVMVKKECLNPKNANMTTNFKKAYSAPKSQQYAFVTEQLLASSPKISINDDIEVDASTSFSNAKSWDCMSWTDQPTD